MTASEIRAAVDAGRTVHWANPGYTVIKDRFGQYSIAYDHGGPQASYIGLTHADGVTLNGAESQFYQPMTPGADPPACAICQAPTGLGDQVLIIRSLRGEGTAYAADLANDLARRWGIDWAVAKEITP